MLRKKKNIATLLNYESPTSPEIYFEKEIVTEKVSALINDDIYFVLSKVPQESLENQESRYWILLSNPVKFEYQSSITNTVKVISKADLVWESDIELMVDLRSVFY